MSYSPLVEPESIARVFVEAWTRRDAEKLASLFDEDAEFLKITGVWRDREAIRKAHAVGLEHVFGSSTLHRVRAKVQSLTGDVAVLYAKLRLVGQNPGHGDVQPATRNTILSFVV